MSTKMKLELLPNEVFLDCFQYLNTSDIFYSFDRLNYRFSRLIRTSPLHLNFYQIKKSLFNQFCQTILSNPEMKQKIIYLQLSNEGTRGQIETFLSLIPLNELSHLRSLSLIKLKDNNLEQLLPMLPFLSNLYCFSVTGLETEIHELIYSVSKLKLRILSVICSTFTSISLYQLTEITSLTILCARLYDLLQLFKYVPMLKYLKIAQFENSCSRKNESNIMNEYAIYLKQLIIDDRAVKLRVDYVKSTYTFQNLEILLKHTPNLRIFSLCCTFDYRDMYDPIRWGKFIKSSLHHLSIFRFYFSDFSIIRHKIKFNDFQQFQTDFGHKPQWYTTYQVYHGPSPIYSIPYRRSEYTLTPNRVRCRNSSMNKSNKFNNVKKLTLMPESIIDNSQYYFRNVELLILVAESYYYDTTDGNEFKATHIEFLHKVVNLFNIKHLIIDEDCYIRSSVFPDLINELPSVSSLTIDEFMVMRYFHDVELCEYLNKKIKQLDISSGWSDRDNHPNKINLQFCQVFSNIEQLTCHYMKYVDELLLILTHCSKLSIIKIERISKPIHSWIQVNASTFNVYLDFQSIDN